MINRVLLYNSGGGMGDSIQLLPLIETLKSVLKNVDFYYLSAHQNYFNSTLKDFNCKIKTLDLGIKYFGFRWWQALIVKKKIINLNIKKFDLIIDLQSKVRNTLILKMIPCVNFISPCFNFKLSSLPIKITKGNQIYKDVLEAFNIMYKKKLELKNYDILKIDNSFFLESKKLLPGTGYVGFSITQGNVYRKKRWPLENIINLSNILIRNNKIPVFLIEKTNTNLINKIKKLLPGALFPENNSDLSSPALVTCLGKRLELAITIDNGIMHLLSLSNVPMISLFGPTDPEKFSPKYKNSIVLDSKKIYKTKDISSITVEDVLKEVKQYLNF